MPTWYMNKIQDIMECDKRTNMRVESGTQQNTLYCTSNGITVPEKCNYY